MPKKSVVMDAETSSATPNPTAPTLVDDLISTAASKIKAQRAVINQAEAAANDPMLTPLEEQAIKGLAAPILQAQESNDPLQDQAQTIPDKEYYLHLDELQEAIAILGCKIFAGEDIIKAWKEQRKELVQQWLDALKSKQTEYRQFLQRMLPF